MDVFSTPGAISWSELITTDPQQAAGFYGSLFGWSFESMPLPTGTYQVIKVGDVAIGGLMAPPEGAPPMPPCWGSYVTVADVDASVAHCVQLGGQLLVPVMEVPNVGRMAVIQDPQGAAINVISYFPREG